MIICDLDDFCDDDRSRADLRRLDALRLAIPTFCATLFTIPGRCDRAFIEWIKETRPWLDLIPHGWMHNDNYECKNWSRAQCKEALQCARWMGITTHGFKAPGWQISDGCYEALAEECYWVADQQFNELRRADMVPSYCIVGDAGIVRWREWQSSKVPPRAIHGHIGHLGGPNANALELIMPEIMKLAAADTDFRFINEVMK